MNNEKNYNTTNGLDIFVATLKEESSIETHKNNRLTNHRYQLASV